MKVSELVEKLQSLDQDAEVCIKGHEYADSHLDLGTVEFIDEHRASRLSDDLVHHRFVSLSA